LFKLSEIVRKLFIGKFMPMSTKEDTIEDNRFGEDIIVNRENCQSIPF